MALLSSLTDDELLRHAHAQFDPITGTDLEQELLKRFAALVDELDGLDPITSAMAEVNLEAPDLKEIFAVLDEFSCTDLKSLRQKLKRADDFYVLADEAGDLFSRLTALQQATL
jgi:hypothetical protein